MKAPCKLSYVSMEPERQGHASYTHVHEIIDGLRALGWKVSLFCPKHEKNKLPSVSGRLWGFLKTILRTVFVGKCDIYYMRWHFAAFPVALWAKIFSIPTVIEVNGPIRDLYIAWPSIQRFKMLFDWLMLSQLRWAGAIVAVTDGLNEMCRDVVSDVIPIATIPNGANTTVFSPEAMRLNNGYTKDLPADFVVFFGTMAPWQGIRTVLAACEHANWPDGLHIVFAGDGKEREAVEAIVRRCLHAHYLGRVPYDILPSIVARARASFVCTENLEGRATTGLAPLKLFESMACGLPIIATQMPFQADVVRSGECGDVVQSQNVDELVDCVVRMISDEDGRVIMGENARRIAVEEHSWVARSKDTHILLMSVLGLGE